MTRSPASLEECASTIHRAETHELLVSRLTAAIVVALACTVASLFTDLAYRPTQLAVLVALKLEVAVALSIAWIGARLLRFASWNVTIAGGLLVALLLPAAPVGRALVTGNPLPVAVLLMVVAIGTAAYFAWGTRAQLAYATLALGTIAGIHYLGAINVTVQSAVAMTAALGASIFLADAVDTQRLEQVRMRLALEDKSTELEGMVAARARFANVASHELRTPLSVIIAGANILRRYRAKLSPAEIDERIARIERAAKSMVDLIDQMLTLGRTEADETAIASDVVDVRTLVDDVIAEIREADVGVHTFIVSHDLDEGAVVLDEGLVRQIVQNLLTNAVKYSPNGGEVRVVVERGDDAVLLRVSDEGIGIPAEYLERLFIPFERAENVRTIKGTGLGLAIARRAAELHGGCIAVESEVGRGTTFEVTLPLRLPPVLASLRA